jgi:hypothetical protein
MFVRLEKLFLSQDHEALFGKIVVKNIAFQKTVVARFTFDEWKTTSEVIATYDSIFREKQAPNAYDEFSFDIELPSQATAENVSVLLCIRYAVNNQEFWDNNEKMNYSMLLQSYTV